MLAEPELAGETPAVRNVVAPHPEGTTALTSYVDVAHAQPSLFCTVTA